MLAVDKVGEFFFLAIQASEVDKNEQTKLIDQNDLKSFLLQKIFWNSKISLY